MESLSMLLSSSSPPLQNNLKTQKPPTSIPIPLSQTSIVNSHNTHFPSMKLIISHNNPRTHLPFILTNLIATTTITLPSFASEEALSSPDQVSDKINLESILVSIDQFLTEYPFFVAGCTFIWLVAIPLVENYLKKYKFISVIDAYKKLRDDPVVQLLDIRDDKTSKYLKSPNLKIVNKETVQVEFNEDDEDGFVKNALQKFSDPANTLVCVLANFDGISIKVAELLVKNGFKETYAIKGGVGGTKGWLESQETLLPPSMHMYPKKKVKASKEALLNGGIVQENEDGKNPASSENIASKEIKRTDNGRITKSVTNSSRSSSPYPNYPDLKPPSSPTPSKPRG